MDVNILILQYFCEIKRENVRGTKMREKERENARPRELEMCLMCSKQSLNIWKLCIWLNQCWVIRLFRGSFYNKELK